MPGGQVIGRVSVKVLPDTDDFRRQAERALEGIESTLEVTVSTKIDMSGAKAGMLEGIRAINAENRTMDSRKIRFYTTISTAGMNDAVSTAVRRLQERAQNNKVKFKVDFIEVTGEVKLVLDRAAADRVKQEIKDWADDISPVTIRVEPDFSSVGARITAARLTVLTRPRTVTIIPRLSSVGVAKVATALAALSGARVLNSMFERLGRTLKNLDKSVPIIGSLATAIAGLAGWGLTAASNLFALSQSLAQIGPLALLLPGLLGGIAVGLGVTIAAFKDFNKVLPEVKEQLSELQNTISENFWEHAAEPIRTMIDELLPEFSAGVAKTATQLGQFFGGFATALQGALNPALEQMFDDLSRSIDVATSGTGAFANIIAVLGKVGTSYLPELAQWFVDISERFSNFLTAAEGDGRLTGWIQTGITNLKELGNVLANLGGILAGVARAAEAGGGSSLSMMADTLERVHKTVDSPGFQDGLTKTFIAAHQAMSNIADISGPAVENLFKTLASLLQAVLPQVGTIIGTALDAIASALAQPAIVEGIKAMFDGLQAAVEALAPAMMPLGAALGSLMQVIGTFATMLGPLVAAALVPLSQAIVAIAPGVQMLIQLLGGALTQVVQKLGPIISNLANTIGGGGLSGGIGGATPLISDLKDGFEQLMRSVGPLVSALGGALITILPPLVTILGQVLAAVMPLVAALADALTPVLPVLASALKQVITALQPIIAVALQIITAVIKPLLPMLSQILQSILPPLADAIQRLLEAIQPILDALLALVNFLMPVLVPVLGFIIELLANSLVGAINGVALVIEGLVLIFQGAWQAIKGYFEIWWGLFEGIFTGDWDRFKQGFSDLWNGILAFLQGIWNVIVGALQTWFNVGILKVAGVGIRALGTLWRSGWNAIKASALAIWNGIRGGFSAFGNALRGVGSTMMSGLRTVFSTGWSTVRDLAVKAWKLLLDAAVEGVKNVVDKAKELPGKIKTGIGDLSEILVNAGKQVMDGLIKGIEAKISSLKSKLKKVTDLIPGSKGPPAKDKILLYNAGLLIMTGLIRGLESQFDNVKKTLTGLTKSIPKTASSGLKALITRDQKEMTKLLSNWDKVADKLDAARKKLDQIRQDAANYAANIRERIIDAADVSKVDAESGFAGIIESLIMARDQARNFATVLAKLKKLGLNATTFDQLVQAGPEAGMAAAEAILQAGKAGVNQVNQLEKELAAAAGNIASTAKSVMYDNGIAMAQGLIKGLEKESNKIEKQMLKIASSMVAAIKRSLGIHSPSRVFMGLGSFVAQGFAKGVGDERDNVISSLENGLWVDGGRSLVDGLIEGMESRYDAVKQSLRGLSKDITGEEFEPPAIGQVRSASTIASAVSGVLNGSTSGGGDTKILNYYAAPGSSISAEEDLFAAAKRARMVGW